MAVHSFISGMLYIPVNIWYLVVQWLMRVPCCLLGQQERAAGALANLAADDKCSMEVASAGGVHALVTLARFCNHEGVQEQVL